MIVELVRVLWLFWGNLSTLTDCLRYFSSSYFDEIAQKNRPDQTPDPPTSLLWKHFSMLDRACSSMYHNHPGVRAALHAVISYGYVTCNKIGFLTLTSLRCCTPLFYYCTTV
jgi:hypothetical protein